MNEPNPTIDPDTATNDDVVDAIEEAEERITASIAPNHRDMYILLVGLIVGFLLSPWCAGRFMEQQSFEQFYYGSGEQWQALEEFKVEQEATLEEKIREILQRHKDVGATDGAADTDVLRVQQEAKEAQAEERIPYFAKIEQARRDHADWVQGAVIALMLAMAVLMFLEPLFEPLGTLAAFRNGLATGRYAIAAAWLALFVAQPAARSGTAVTFFVLVTAVAVFAAVLPWMLVKGRKG